MGGASRDGCQTARNDNRRLLSIAEAERSWRIFGVLMMAPMTARLVLTLRAAFADAVKTGTAATDRMAELGDGQEIACEGRDRD